MKKVLLNTLYFIVLTCFCLGATVAQTPGKPRLPKALPMPMESADLKIDMAQQAPFKKSVSKLSPDLNNLILKRYPAMARTETVAKPSIPTEGMEDLMQISGGRIVIDVTVRDGSKSARIELEKLGFKVYGIYGRIVSGTIPIESLPRIESVSTIRYVRPAYRTQKVFKRVSNIYNQQEKAAVLFHVISQGDTAQRSYLARNKYSVNGKGVKVGILSTSFNILGTAQKSVMNDELPGPGNPSGFVKPVDILLEGDSSEIDEGRGMAEIIHDVAPGSDMAFYSALYGQASFANGILDLAKAGCQVLVDDIGYFFEPYFEDGIIAQAVDAAKSKGVTYFSAAGNDGNASYESAYQGTTSTPLGAGYGTAHNFSAPNQVPRYYQPVYIPRGGSFLPILQWDQPFYSQGGDGAETDLDIWLVNRRGAIVAGSDDANIGGDPLEYFQYINRTQDSLFFVVITKYEGPNPNRIKYLNLGYSTFYNTIPATPGNFASTLIGHPNAAGAIATGAAWYYETPAYGLDTPRIEYYSSLGGTPITLNRYGGRITPVIRKKPEITAPDGVNTSFFPALVNEDIPEDSDTFPNFFGTSAAAPHAAGVAALMIQAQKLGTITPDQIKGVLSTHTYDMDNPYTAGFDKGFDYATGTGLIKADEAVNVVRFPNLYVNNLKLTPVCSDYPATTRRWKISNPNPFDVSFSWFITGDNNQQGRVMLAPGDTIITTSTFYLGRISVPNIMVVTWEDNFGFPRLAVETSSKAACSSNLALATNRGVEEMSIADAEGMNKLNTADVFPNPAVKNFRVYVSFANPQNISIELYSLEGKKLYQKEAASKGVYDIDASPYKPGLYLLKVSQGEIVKTMKVIKQ